MGVPHSSTASKAVFGRELRFEDVCRVLDLAAARTRQIAAKQRLQHQHQRVLLAAGNFCFSTYVATVQACETGTAILFSPQFRNLMLLRRCRFAFHRRLVGGKREQREVVCGTGDTPGRKPAESLFPCRSPRRSGPRPIHPRCLRRLLVDQPANPLRYGVAARIARREQTKHRPGCLRRCARSDTAREGSS